MEPEVPHKLESGTQSAHVALTLRDYFAAAALTGMVNVSTDMGSVVEIAYRYADRMLDRRELGRGGGDEPA